MKRQPQPRNTVSSISRFACLGSLICLLAAVGCTTGTLGVQGTGADDTEPLEAHARPAVPDVPVPTGFAMVEETSRSFESRSVRFIDHNYAGRATKLQVERFYQKHLPARGWEFQTSQMVRGVHMMRFAKDGEVLDLQISDDQSPFRDGRVNVHFTIQAIGSAPSEIEIEF